MKKLLAVAAIATLAACSQGKQEQQSSPPIASEATTRTISQGELIGFEANNGVHVWRGIRYAASTEGENRWRAPRPTKAWQGTYEALSFGNRCPQITNSFAAAEGMDPGLLIGSEDCLFLNIYAPENVGDKKLPVMFWIHGGANVWGSADPYDGSFLAKNENVIVVTINYRLGPLGWFSSPLLRDAAEDTPDKAANFGTLDIIAALDWVNRNIAAFGGDADNVTIFGESAGGHNVVTMLASPLAEGLFHKAIIQSGSFDSNSVTDAEGTSGELLNNSQSIEKVLAVKTAEELRALSVADFYAPYYKKGQGIEDMPRIIQDGVVLPEEKMRNLFADKEKFNAVPIITGTNKDELKLFNIGDDRLVKKALGVFTVARNQKFYDASSDYGSRLWRLRSVDLPAALMHEAGHQDVYAYQFDWDEGGKVFLTDFSKLFGAAHALEIPFVFNNFVLFGELDDVLFKEKTFDDREKLSRQMGRYWARFAYTGNPNDGEQLYWPTYAVKDTVLHLDTDSDGGLQLREGREALSKILSDLKANATINQKQKCQVAAQLVGWVPELEAKIAEEFSCEA